MNDKRCRSSDGKQGRCSCPAMDGNVYCGIHYVLAKVRGRNNMRFESNDDGGVLKKFKASSDGGSLKKLNHHTLGAREDEEDEKEVWTEREENPISAFTRRRNSSGRNISERNPVERIQHSQSPLNSSASGENALDKKIKHSDDMEADLDRAIKANKELAERNNSLAEELCKAKEQSCKKLQDMKTKLDEAELVNRDLDKRNNKLKEELNRATERVNSSERNLEQTRKKLQNLCTTFSAVKEECDQACTEQEKTGVAQHLSKKRKYVLKVYEVNDWVNCSICFEPWTESGEHNAWYVVNVKRICNGHLYHIAQGFNYPCKLSLSCGHFFGRSCITQWISRNGGRDFSTCPICSKRTALSDIRHHYVSQIYDGMEKFEHGD